MKIRKREILRLSVGLVILLLVWFIWDGFIKDKTPQFFPINEQQGEYSIIKSSDDVFMVKYSGPKAFSDISSVMIGKTDYDLNQYLGKKVLITKGSFKSGFTQQCIASICKDIGGPYAAIVIQKMEEIQETRPSVLLINAFTGNTANALRLEEKLNDPYSGHVVENYVDENNVNYSVDMTENEIVYYNTLFSKVSQDIQKPKISMKTALTIGVNFLKKYYKQFDIFRDGASFEQTDGVETKIDVYSFSWQKKKNDLPYHVVINVDKFGNVVLMQREYISELIDTHIKK